MDARGHMFYKERRLAPVGVMYKAGVRKFTLDDEVPWVHHIFGCENRLPSQFVLGQAAVIDELADHQDVDKDQGDWDLQKADKSVPEVPCNEEQVLLRPNLESCKQIGMTVHCDAMRCVFSP